MGHINQLKFEKHKFSTKTGEKKIKPQNIINEFMIITDWFLNK